MRRYRRMLSLVVVLVVLGLSQSLALGLMVFQVVLKGRAGQVRKKVAWLALTPMMAKMTSSYEMTPYFRRPRQSL
jgi:hypothetical protein